MSASSYRDTDSSNESFESDSSSRVNVSNNSVALEERAKWMGQVAENQNSWKQTEEDNVWLKDIHEQWKILGDQLINWPLQESGSESFLKGLMHTPFVPRGFPPPPKPDSPPEVYFGYQFLYALYS